MEEASKQWEDEMEAGQIAIEAAEKKGKNVEEAKRLWQDAAAASHV